MIQMGEEADGARPWVWGKSRSHMRVMLTCVLAHLSVRFDEGSQSRRDGRATEQENRGVSTLTLCTFY